MVGVSGGGEHLHLFSKGSHVEVGTDEEGFTGSWYVATVIGTPSRLSSASKTKNPNSNKYYVEYQNLLDDDGVTPLREHVNVNFLRPLPSPSETGLVHSLELYDVVDAFYRDGWWTGFIARVLDNSRFLVTFQNPPDEIEFGLPELRVHREWLDGKWVRPEKQRTGLMFSAGKRVEVSFDREDYCDVWFPATVLEELGNNSFLVEHQSLGNGDKAVLVKVTVDSLHIRPSPHLNYRKFVLLEKVNAFYNFGWWSGVITKELANERYIVYFKSKNTEMELSWSELRPHMEWIDGKWIAASTDINQLKGGEDMPKKRRGRPSVAVKKRNGDVVSAHEMVVKDCMANEVELPTITVVGSKKLPNGQTRRKDILSSMKKVLLSETDKPLNEKVVHASSKQLEKLSSKGEKKRRVSVNIGSAIQDSQDSSRGKRNEDSEMDSMVKEVGMTIDEVPDNVSDDRPLSTWFEGVTPKWTVQQFTETSEGQIEIPTQAATGDGNGDIVRDLNQCLPFVKTFPLWEMIESMEVFQVMPQMPHFRPFNSFKESSREGLAIGCMVTFSGVVKKTTELQFDDPRSSIEDSLETLIDLEGHGFDVKMVRDRLTGMLLIKDRQEILQDQSKELESQIMEHNKERTKINEEIDEIDKQIKVLQEKRAFAMSMKEIKDSKIGSLQSSMKSVDEGIKSIQLDFEELAAAPW